MRAILHIRRQTFNVCDEADDVINRRLLQFAEMVTFAESVNRNFPDNETIFIAKKADLLRKQNVYRDVKVEDFIRRTDEVRRRCPDDVRLLFAKALTNLQSEKSQPQLVEHLKKPAMHERHGLCVLKHNALYPPKVPQVVAGKQDLIAFRVGHYVEFEDSDAFFEECNHYLDGLRLHPDIRTEFRQRYKTHRRQMCGGLLALNSSYLEGWRSIDPKTNLDTYTKLFAGQNGIDDGSVEGNAARTSSHKRVYPDTNEEKFPGPHLKFNQNDSGAFELARIYFSPPAKTDRILCITHILKHLQDKGKKLL